MSKEREVCLNPKDVNDEDRPTPAKWNQIVGHGGLSRAGGGVLAPVKCPHCNRRMVFVSGQIGGGAGLSKWVNCKDCDYSATIEA